MAALVLWRLQRWPFAVALFAGLSAVVPFATLLFERWADRRGHLTATTAPAADVATAGKRDEARAQERAVEETAVR
jgi:hypothetical protein